MKMPAFQFYPGDWRKDPGVQALSRHDRSVWFDMLCIMHESDERGVLLLAGKPMPEAALAAVLGLDNQTFNQSLTTILTYGVASRRESDGAIYSRRMVKDELLCQVRREAGKKGGNPGLVNQKPKQKPTTQDKQIPTPSSSTSSSIPSDDGSAGEASSSAEVQPLKAEKGGKPLAPNPARDTALATTDPQDEQPLDASPLVKPVPFRLICERNNFVGIDYEHYLTQAYAAAVRSNAKPRTVTQWEGWIVKYLNNQGGPATLVRPGQAVKAAPDPEADRLRAVAAQAQPQLPAAGYVPYTSGPNRPTGASEPAVSYGPTSTAKGF